MHQNLIRYVLLTVFFYFSCIHRNRYVGASGSNPTADIDDTIVIILSHNIRKSLTIPTLYLRYNRALKSEEK